LIVTAFVNVALTYFQLAAEDHEWWWRYVWCNTKCFLYLKVLYSSKYIYILRLQINVTNVPHLISLTWSFLTWYQVFPLWWINWFVHLWVLHVFLPCKIRYVWFHANLFLFRLYGLHLLWFLPHAWNCRFPSFFNLCQTHIPFRQVWIAKKPTGINQTICFTLCSVIHTATLRFRCKWFTKEW
jgi:hypothetical protein